MVLRTAIPGFVGALLGAAVVGVVTGERKQDELNADIVNAKVSFLAWRPRYGTIPPRTGEEDTTPPLLAPVQIPQQQMGILTIDGGSDRLSGE
jgi:hypothetical protein